jgi:polar amino acid transport system substrate-binding protein
MNKPRLFNILFLVTLLTLFIVPSLFALPASQESEDTEPLKVAIKDIEPFIFEEGDKKAGFSIDLWQALMVETGLSYEFVEVSSVTEQIDAVELGDVDMALAAISMTAAREEVIDFSHPYFDAGLQIMTRNDSFLSLRSLVKVLFSPEVMAALVGLVLVIILFGHLVWLFERRNNEHFQHGYLRGVWEGIWWSAVTVTTVGYGDRTPQAVLGRLLALIWMFVGLFVIANFTATITTQLTLNELRSQVSGVNDLRNKRIATVAGSSATEFLRENNLSFIGVTTIEDAYDLLRNKDITAIIFDAPVLRYYMATGEYRHQFQVVGDLMKKETYGIALPEDSPYEDVLNQALLTLHENGTYDEIYDKWFSIK